MEEGIQERQKMSYAVIRPSNQQNSSYVPAKPTNKTESSSSTVSKQPVITTRRPPAFGQIVKKQVWVEEKPTIPGVLPGLQYLTSLDQVFVKQHIDMMEESDKWNRQLQGPDRGFNLRVLDNTSQEVMRFSREHICCGGCCCGYCESLRQVLTVEAPVGDVIGYVRQEFNKSGPCYSVRDAEDTIVYKITGPCCVCDCPCNRVRFPIVSADDTEEVGVISKNLGIENYFGDADTFGAKFPLDIDVKIKAVLLGAILLIDFSHFEQGQQHW
ncbi:phospholipid scramblase 1-like isoform X2 [Mytilus trossulus]|uniref:phospholipid scramblase 1-like isoform X2 n=1 Tax=Mytilus trossulus TaxID=6551 RepID=UPI0030047D28